MPSLPIPARLGVILASVILIGGCTGAAKTTAEVPPVTVTVVKPVAGSAERHFAFRATVVPRTLVNVVAETAAGRIVELQAEVGQRLAAGEVMARLDDREIRLRRDQSQAERAKVAATLAQAQAQLTEAQATLEDARSQLKRIDGLVAGGNASVEMRDARQATVAVDEARLRAATAQVTAAEADIRRLDAHLTELALAIERAVITAPVAGLVVRRNAEVGDLLAQGATLASLAHDGQSELAAEIPERYLPAIAVGQAATCRIGDAEVALTVRRSDGLTDAHTRTGIVRMASSEPLPAVLGAVVVGRIPVATVSGLRLPMTALRRLDPALVMVVRGGRVAAQPVELAFSDGATAILASGVGADDLVVAKAPGLVEDGQKVQTVAADAR